MLARLANDPVPQSALIPTEFPAPTSSQHQSRNPLDFTPKRTGTLAWVPLYNCSEQEGIF